MNRTCAALTDSAAEFRSRQADIIANGLQQGRLWIDIDGITRCILYAKY